MEADGLDLLVEKEVDGRLCNLAELMNSVNCVSTSSGVHFKSCLINSVTVNSPSLTFFFINDAFLLLK